MTTHRAYLAGICVVCANLAFGEVINTEFLDTLAKAQPPAAAPQNAEVTHIAFVIDTSAPMRDPRTNQLFDGVIRAVVDTLSLFPKAQGFRMTDSDGRDLTQPTWLPLAPGGAEAVRLVLSTSSRQSTVPNPVPGLGMVLRTLPADPGAKVYVVVIGNQHVGENLALLPPGIARLNPPGPDGKPRVRISAIQVPTSAIGSATYTNFESLMKRITAENGGTFVQLDPSALSGPTPAGRTSTPGTPVSVPAVPGQIPPAPNPGMQGTRY